MKKKTLEKKIEENIKIILTCGADTNDLLEAYIKKASKKEMKKFQKRMIKKFEKKFEEVFENTDTFDL